MSSSWKPTGTKPWPEWKDMLGWTRDAHPERWGPRRGQHVRRLGLGDQLGYAKDKKDAFDFISTPRNKENTLTYSVGSGDQIAPRKDVSGDPRYTADNPSVKFWTDLASVTHYRPAYEVYPKVSAEMQKAMEAVTTGSKSPEAAAKDYADALPGVVGGQDKVASGS